MAVDATSPLKIYLFSGAGTYGVTFKVLEASHIQAQLIRPDGTIVGLVNGTDYSVTILPAGAGANIVVTTEAYASGGTIEIRRVIPVTQATSWANGGSLDMPLLTAVFDKLTMILQQMQVYMEGEAAESFWRGDWATGTSYLVKDIVVLPSTGDWYRCLTAHTSGTWATDLAAGKWVLYLAIGEATSAAATATGAADTAVGAAAAAAEDAAEAAASAATAVNAPGTNATSNSSITPATGEKTLTLAQTGKAFVVGMHVVAAQTSNPASNFMHGIITAFTPSTGAMTVDVDFVSSAAEAANDWSVMLSAPLPAVVPVGYGQSWVWPDVGARTVTGTYQNDTGQAIQIAIAVVAPESAGYATVYIGPSATATENVAVVYNYLVTPPESGLFVLIVPDGHYYAVRVTGGVTLNTFSELRRVA